MKSDAPEPTVVDGDFHASLRLHDQMLSCLDFVIEKWRGLHAMDRDLDHLLQFRDVVLRERDKVMAPLRVEARRARTAGG